MLFETVMRKSNLVLRQHASPILAGIRWPASGWGWLGGRRAKYLDIIVITL